MYERFQGFCEIILSKLVKYLLLGGHFGFQEAQCYKNYPLLVKYRIKNQTTTHGLKEISGRLCRGTTVALAQAWYR